MLPTYKAILRGNYIEWRESAPLSPNPEQPMTVLVTILDEAVIEKSYARCVQRDNFINEPR
ncbi:hypothetical protein DP117_20945 [Brasilonema sp. UFV-L1]|uniref:hypothetical protein n=1 Tax=Brasilonema sp. UFV-L1 TaxID=2234130 RepID=UPI0016B90AC5|nr:hypothetical protein [Brasilonema sp. UFV-L1]